LLTSAEFLAKCLLLDLETDKNNVVRHIGALFGGERFERSGRFDLSRALSELNTFATDADFLLGHNLLGHDLPVLQSLSPQLPFLAKPVVDTLYLSPLAFPENPYHRLVKDYKLVRDAMNDPVSDARIAASLFYDQWESFAASRADLVSFYRYCFDVGGAGEACPLRGEGLKAVFEALGAEALSENAAFAVFENGIRDGACRSAIPMVSFRYLLDPEKRPALAYCLAWLRVAGHNSVLPQWVRHRFPDVVPILRELRDVPTPASANGKSLQEEIVRYGCQTGRSSPSCRPAEENRSATRSRRVEGTPWRAGDGGGTARRAGAARGCARGQRLVGISSRHPR
jgi:ATP-dependent DNA helicase RecQ